MPGGATAYLVIKRDDGYGDVFPLYPNQVYTLGRVCTNTIVLKDDLCSREHAEDRFSDGCWRLRDLSSLNGTRVNNQRIENDVVIDPGDEVEVGHTRALFVEDMNQLPDIPVEPTGEEMAIKKRLGSTRYLTPVPPESGTEPSAPTDPPSRHSLSRDLSLLYRLALDMGSADGYDDLIRLVLD